MSSLNSMRLRELIRAVRQCHNTNEERALINRQSAVIRDTLKDAAPLERNRLMLMLLYIRMLGYATEFSQVEVVNLIAHHEFSGKRIGYLALQVILAETDEVLTLAVNHMKTDMSNVHDPLVQTTALGAAANIASVDMAHDIFDDVLRLVTATTTTDAYTRSKAYMAAVRIVRRVPGHAEYFLEHLTDIFSERNASALLCGLTLVNTCLRSPCEAVATTWLPQYRRLAAAAARTLKSLVLSSHVSEYDILTVAHPFLQARLLEFMRLVGRDSAAASEAMHDALTQTMTNTDASRSIGCAMHYECVRTVDAIDSDADLRELAVHTVSRFLGETRDNNLRFVALQALLRYAHTAPDTVVQLQRTIFDCLRDADVSIRRRALALTVMLVNDGNVRLLTPDLLAYIGVCASELRGEVVQHVCAILEHHSPSAAWRIEYSLKLLKVAEEDVSYEFATRLLALLSRQSREVQTRAVVNVWDEAAYAYDAVHHARRAFVLVALWTLGEYGDLLLQQRQGSVRAADIATCLSDLTSNTNSTLLKQYGVTALMKLAARMPETRPVALATIRNSTTALDCELQQRACEYVTLLTSYAEEAAFCFGRMPPIPDEAAAATTADDDDGKHDKAAERVVAGRTMDGAAAATSDKDKMIQAASTTGAAAAAATTANMDDVLLSLSASPSPQPSAAAPPVRDALADLFGGSDTPLAPPPSHTMASPAVAGTAAAATTAAAPPAPTALEVYRCDDFVAALTAHMRDAHTIAAVMTVRSLLATAMTGLSFQVAVPRTCHVTVAALPSTHIDAHGQLLQHVDVDTRDHARNPRELMLRVKLAYAVAGGGGDGEGAMREHVFQVTHVV